MCETCKAATGLARVSSPLGLAPSRLSWSRNALTGHGFQPHHRDLPEHHDGGLIRTVPGRLACLYDGTESGGQSGQVCFRTSLQNQYPMPLTRGSMLSGMWGFMVQWNGACHQESFKGCSYHVSNNRHTPDQCSRYGSVCMDV